MSNKDWRIGIDVGGTNTDAVVLDENLNLISAVKSPTTEDVMSGIENAMEAVLAGEGVDRSRIGYAMLGTTHCTNAIVERKRLDRVAVIRIGAPATRATQAYDRLAGRAARGYQRPVVPCGRRARVRRSRNRPTR